LWRDDLDTAFRHLDLYDRFGCPSGHIQVTFRCLVLHANTIDPKAADSLNGRVHACWINPSLQPQPAPAAAAQTPTPTRSSGTRPGLTFRNLRCIRERQKNRSQTAFCTILLS